MSPLEMFTEDVTLGGPAGPSTWWAGYQQVLESEGFGRTSIAVVDSDSAFIVERGILGAGGVDSEGWPAGRVRTGVVVGAVQSGKTASMMAVAARAVDEAIDVLVVLAGTRTSLWLQTYERFRNQLDTLPDRLERRVLRPSLDLPVGEIPPVSGLYSLQKPAAKKALAKGRPIIAIAMKQVDHLERLGDALRNVVYPAAAELGKKIHLVVIDDEADDASIDDPNAPSASLQAKQVPTRIVELWGNRNSPWATVDDNVHATYVAYTATPQANFLQDNSNPLAPRNFVVALRTPGSKGDLSPREATFREPAGLASWYTGGSMFYRTFEDEQICVVTDPASEGEHDEVETDEHDEMFDAVRAFLVASAVRLMRAPDRLGPRSALGHVFASSVEARAKVAPPASMLVHPSAAKDAHFAMAEVLYAWSRGEDVPIGGAVPQGRYDLGSEGIRRDMIDHLDRWQHWLESYGRSAVEVGRRFGDPHGHDVPHVDGVAQVLRVVLDEVVPGTTISVVNSDSAADDRPRFGPVPTDGGWAAAPNLSTVFVAGNVMSRGLTLEGLTTTYFSRASNQPSADTQMQMQRWFGFRGKFIELCRVFLRREQLELFVQYHEHDEALRRDILARMSEVGGSADLTVLQGRTHSATAKVSNVRGVTLSPGEKPFLKILNAPEEDSRNQQVVHDLFDVGREELIVDSRGVLLARHLSFTEAATMLESLVFTSHSPSRDGASSRIWRSLENHIGEVGLGAFPLYRPSGHGPDSGISLGSLSPSYIGAYLRLWAACCGRPVPGLMTTGDVPAIWNLSPSGQPGAMPPKFSLGLRFGPGAPVYSGPLASLPFDVGTMRRARDGGGDLSASWGSRNYRGDVAVGDEVFDRDLRHLSPARGAGDDGLILVHPIARENGVSLAFGIALPPGGPDHVRAER